MIDYLAEIEKIKSTRAFLEKCQEEYERMVTIVPNDKSINPKVLQHDLSSLKRQFSAIQHNYLVLLSEQIFLQHLRDDLSKNPIDPRKSVQLEANTNALRYKLTMFNRQCDDVYNKIGHLAGSLFDIKNKWTPVMEECSMLVQQINLMLEELQRIQMASALVSSSNIEQTKNTLQQQAEELAQLHMLVEETQDAIAEQQWYIEDLENEKQTWDTRREMSEKDTIVTQLEDMHVNDKYIWYQEQEAKLLEVYGVEAIDFVSDSTIHITLDVPYDVKIHIKHDKNRIKDVTISGIELRTKEIEYILSPAKKTDLQNGVSMIAIEVLSLLKSETALIPEF